MPSVLEELQDAPIHELKKDALPELAEKEEVMGIPSLLVYQNGEKLGNLLGNGKADS